MTKVAETTRALTDISYYIKKLDLANMTTKEELATEAIIRYLVSYITYLQLQ